ncbi:hypothetical protein SSS_08694 [Sarcoptes scabiei]|nr:hypothetical protein SSS_08694 [Sarcoptes scabiei]
MSREFDLVIFGATGFTGFFVVRELLLSIKNDPKKFEHIKWAVAGRNTVKLTDKLVEVGDELNQDLSSITKIIADVMSPESLLEMAKRTSLVINCVGPYYLYGRSVVEACIQAETHHIDISGEPNYIESMILEFHQKALEKNLIIVSTCGWDSIPCDIGVQFAKNEFKGRLHSVESYLQVMPGINGYSINFGTLASIIYGYKHMRDLKQIRGRLFTEIFIKKLPRSRITLERKKMPFSHPSIKGWNVEFPGSDRSVVKRTQHFNYENFNEYPLQIQTYYTVANLKHLLGLIWFGAVIATLTMTDFGCRLLSAYPKFFSFGKFSKQGPSREQIESTKFQTIIFGKGWSQETIESNGVNDMIDEPKEEPNQQIIVKVSGPDPGYMATSICIVQSALTIFLESDKIRKSS